MDDSAAPKLARRGANKRSTMKSGRTIGERREKLETASERAAARDKIKRRQRRRIAITTLAFITAIAAVIIVVNFLFSKGEDIVTTIIEDLTPTVTYTPTIEVIDEDAGDSGAQITSRMKEYIGQAEADFRELGYTPVKAVIPSGAIREVDFYLDGVPGYIKLVIDRGSGVSTEDAARLLRYLAEQGTTDFTYIDVRIDGKAYWK